MDDLGESGIIFRISNRGEVKYYPHWKIQSSNEKMGLVLDIVAEEAAKFMEKLFQEKLK